MANPVKDFGLISKDSELIKRAETLCEEFDYQYGRHDTVEAFMETEDVFRMVLFSCQEEGDAKLIAQEATEIAQGITHQCPEAFKVAVIKKMLTRDDVAFLKKSGVDTVIYRTEIAEGSKLEFLATQFIRAQYVPVKEIDLVANVALPFDLYHLMPLSRKFLKILAAGREFDERKLEKMREVGEFYIHRSQLSQFNQFTREFAQEDGGVIRKCRGQFLDFYAKYTDMVMVLTDRSETLSYDEGKELMASCQEMVKNLAEALSVVEVDSIWDVVNNSTIGEFGSLERTPAIAAYTAFFAMKMGSKQLENLIFASLISDLGLLFLEAPVTRKLRAGKVDEMHDEEKKEYCSYPLKSVDVVLNRKLPLEEKLKNVVLRCHERADGKGFPKGLNGEKLSPESQLLGFAWYFDQKTCLSMGKERMDRKEALKEIIEEQIADLGRFSPQFIMSLKKAFGGKSDVSQIG